MNGPEHYLEAERLVALVDDLGPVISVPLSWDRAAAERIKDQFESLTGAKPAVVGGGVEIHTSPLLVAAQVHATLALAAATAENHGGQWQAAIR